MFSIFDLAIGDAALALCPLPGAVLALCAGFYDDFGLAPGFGAEPDGAL